MPAFSVPARALAPVWFLAACGRADRCDLPSDCGSAELCAADGRCEPILDREWEVLVESASAGPEHPAGGAWDDDGTPPDLYAEFGLEDGDGCVTSIDADRFAPVWNEACFFYVPGDPLFLVNLWDVDGGAEEFVAGYYWEGDVAFGALARDWGRPLVFTDETGEVTLSVSVFPTP